MDTLMAKSKGGARRRKRGREEERPRIKTPSWIPSGWTVYNAFRPLMGTLIGPVAWVTNGRSATWQDKAGANGWHFAAIDPNDPMGDMWRKNNKSMRAKRVGTS